MAYLKRVFVFGAGFSKPARMPLATELLPLLITNLELEEQDEMRAWLDSLCERMAWLSGDNQEAGSFALSIEQVFHYAHFDIEAHRFKQHLVSVGRHDGPDTPWTRSESIAAWLFELEEALRDVILECDDNADLTSIVRWAEFANDHDTVLTFNYDTLVERAIATAGKPWNHGTVPASDTGIPVFKLHGSIDWVVAHRCESFSKLDLLFDKTNENRLDRNTGHVEDDYRLWRSRTREQLRKWIEGRDLQSVPNNASPRTVGIAGLGAYKELHQVPGLGHIWRRGLRALYNADLAVVIGFSMSDFDAMAQMQFAQVASARARENRDLHVTVINPYVDEAAKKRFRQVFRNVDFVESAHESFDWSSLN